MTLPATSRNSRSFIRASRAGRGAPGRGKLALWRKPRPPAPRGSPSLTLRRAAMGPVCPWDALLPAPLDIQRALGLQINSSQAEQPAGSTAQDGPTAIFNRAGSHTGTEPQHKGQQENSPRSQHLLQGWLTGVGTRVGHPARTGSPAYTGRAGSAGNPGRTDAMPCRAKLHPGSSAASVLHRQRCLATALQGHMSLNGAGGASGTQPPLCKAPGVQPEPHHSSGPWQEHASPGEAQPQGR